VQGQNFVPGGSICLGIALQISEWWHGMTLQWVARPKTKDGMTFAWPIRQ
jgi:hypothetical protein